MKKVLVAILLIVASGGGEGFEFLNDYCTMVEYGQGEVKFGEWEANTDASTCAALCDSTESCILAEYDELFEDCRIQTFAEDAGIVLYRCEELMYPEGAQAECYMDQFGAGIVTTLDWESQVDFDACKQQCETRVGCQAFEYKLQAQSENCRYHDFVGYWDVPAYVKRCPPIDQITEGCSLFGRGLMEFSAWYYSPSVQQCAADCDNNPLCQAYEFYSAQSQCRLQTFFERDYDVFYRCLDLECSFEMLGQGMIITGNWYRVFDLEKCYADCAAVACHAYEYDENSHDCRIHEFLPDPDVELHERNCPPTDQIIQVCQLKEYGLGWTAVGPAESGYTINTCDSDCSDSSDCEGFEFNYDHGTCKTLTFIPDPDVLQYRMSCQDSDDDDCSLRTYGYGAMIFEVSIDHTLNSCFDRCNNWNGCDAFEYYSVSKDCRLHLFEDHDEIVQFRRQCQVDSVGDCPITEYVGLYSNNGDLFYEVAEYLCKERCENDNACVGATYTSANQNCRIHTSNSQLIDSTEDPYSVQFRKICSGLELINEDCTLEFYGYGLMEFSPWDDGVTYTDETCKAKCMAEQNVCLGFDYDDYYKDCRRHTFTPRDDVALYRCAELGGPEGECAMALYGEGALNIEGWVYNFGEYIECYYECQRTPDCIAFEYQSSTEGCRIHWFGSTAGIFLNQRRCADAEPISECLMRDVGNFITYMGPEMDGYTLNTCQSFCTETEGCWLFEYNKDHDSCRIYTRGETEQVKLFSRECQDSNATSEDCSLVNQGDGELDITVWMDSSSEASCKANCSATESCVGGEFFIDDNKCRLHLFEEHKEIVQFREECPGAVQITDCPLDVFGAVESSGGERLTATTEEECKNLCLNYAPLCVGVTFYDAFNECTVFTDDSTFDSSWNNVNVVQYRRNCLA